MKNKKRNLLDWLEKLATLYSKEMMHYFHTPLAYVVIVVFLLISGYLFATPLFLNNQATIVAFSEIAPLLFTFFVPAITMRLFAEEYKTGTIEVLFTNPVTIMQVTLAKLAFSNLHIPHNRFFSG
jgi:ABC-2 type transport system permease protein